MLAEQVESVAKQVAALEGEVREADRLTRAREGFGLLHFADMASDGCCPLLRKLLESAT
jgi:hypothetical protein